MDTRTGNIVPGGFLDEIEKLADKDKAEALKKRLAEFMEMVVPPTPRQKMKMKVGRNDPCPCDSGKKFKKCCLIGEVPKLSASEAHPAKTSRSSEWCSEAINRRDARISDLEAQLAHWVAEADRHAGTAQHALAQLAERDKRMEAVSDAWIDAKATIIGKVMLSEADWNDVATMETALSDPVSRENGDTPDREK